MSDDIQSILSSPLDKGVSPASPAAESTETQAEPVETKAEKADQTRDDGGRFAKTEAEKTEKAADAAKAAPVEPKVEAKPEPMVPLSALLAERARRNKAEPQKAKTDFWDNPDQAVNERMREHLEPLEAQNFELRRQIARLQNPDFDEVVKEFLIATQADELVRHQLDTAADPLMFAYNEGKRRKELAPYGGDFAKYRDGITAELRGELTKRDEMIKGLQAQVEALNKAQKNIEDIPRSLNKGNSDAVANASDADPPDINELVRFKTG